ncbi:MAG: DUF1059 domain-containing protein [Bacteroidota bacterium]|nr:DUF1059 domain-containing protein [Ferruginibacter sp.]
MKTLHCREAGFDCDTIIQANTEYQVLELVSKHALEVHEVAITPELAEQLRTMIREEKEII